MDVDNFNIKEAEYVKAEYKKNKSYTTEDISSFINNYENESELLPFYVDYIRNGYIFTQDMLNKIENFNDTSKMKIILEFNRVMEIFNKTIK